MKKFACGDVVPGCGRTFAADSDDEILAAVARHAAADHGVASVPEAMVAQVRLRIVDA